MLIVCSLVITGGHGSPNISNMHLELDRALQSALETHGHNEKIKSENSDHIDNENKNQGLINTIINHNKKIKNIENKYNYVINNFANSSHVKEIVHKTKELERHVFGPPRPHSSWREFLLLASIVGASVVLLIKLGKKYVGPWLVKYIQKKTSNNIRKIPSISERVQQTAYNKTGEAEEIKIMFHHLDEQNEKLKEMKQELIELREREIAGNEQK